MAASKFDFVKSNTSDDYCEIGADFSQELAWEIAQVPEGDPLVYEPVDITGYEGKMQIRSDVGSEIIAEISTDNGRMTMDGPNGLIFLFIPASVTATLVAGTYKYDLFLKDEDDHVAKLFYGKFQIYERITTL